MIRRLPILALVTAILFVAQAADAQYKARPVISSLSPASGPPGTVVTINGQNFGPEYSVEYNGVALQPKSVSATKIVVQLPANAVQGRLTLRGPTHQVTSPQVFWVVQSKSAPVITLISPATGPPGTVITITGNNFSSKGHENTVTISGAPVAVRSASTTRITGVIPTTGRTGNITVQVYNAGQATSPQSFTVLSQLAITAFTPAMGPPGTHVEITGSGFSVKKNNNTVKIGDQKCKIINVSSNKMTVALPKKNVESGRFNVTVKGLGTYEHPTIFPVAYPPDISTFSPAAGNIDTEVTIKGTHFGINSAGIQVLLTGRKCHVLSANENEIRVRVPQGSVSGKFKIIVPKMGTAESDKIFEVWAPLSVTRMDPVFGMPGTMVKIFGSGFRAKASDHTLYLSDEKVKIIKIEGGALVFKIPTKVVDGPVSFRLEVKDRGATMIPMRFTVMHSPEIADFSPLRGPVGTAVVINGNYFGTRPNHVRILLGGQVIPATSVTPNQIMLTIPPGAASEQFEIQTMRRGGAKSKKTFEVFVPVRVTSFLPSMGYGGQTVHLFGSGFGTTTKQNTVSLNGVKLKVIDASPSRLKVKLAKKVTTGGFKVEVPGRGSSETIQKFNVVNQIRVKSFDPPNGVPRTYVTIKGAGFENSGLRGYIGKTPIGVRIDSPNKVTIAIPPGAESGKFLFTAPGAGRSEAGSNFKVLIPLIVTGFQPAYGPVGTKVSLYGSGFDLRPNKTKVTYGRQVLKVENGSSDTMLVVTIPKNSNDSSFKIKVRGRGDTESENIFSVVKPVSVPTKPTPAPTPAPVVATAPPATAPAATPPYAAPATAPAATPPYAAPATAPAATPPATQPVSLDDMMGIAKVQPKITSFEPGEGPVGELIMIEGSGFGEDMDAVKAWIGNVPAPVLGVLDDMIQIEVPMGVRRGAIKIKVGANPITKSAKLFVVQE